MYFAAVPTPPVLHTIDYVDEWATRPMLFQDFHAGTHMMYIRHPRACKKVVDVSALGAQLGVVANPAGGAKLNFNLLLPLASQQEIRPPRREPTPCPVERKEPPHGAAAGIGVVPGAPPTGVVGGGPC